MHRFYGTWERIKITYFIQATGKTKIKAYLKIRELKTPLDVCIRRDTLRKNPIGQMVIRKMFKDYYK